MTKEEYDEMVASLFESHMSRLSPTEGAGLLTFLLLAFAARELGVSVPSLTNEEYDTLAEILRKSIDENAELIKRARLRLN